MKAGVASARKSGIEQLNTAGNELASMPMRLSTYLFLSFGLAALLGSASRAQDVKPHKLEPLLLMPEPHVLRSELSTAPDGAVLTVFTPAHEIAAFPGIASYSAEEFKKLGLSVETFGARARKAADKLLASLKPDLIKNADGKVLYAVYRGDRSVMAALVVAPSLPGLFKESLGAELWAALPDQHSLFLFPAKAEAMAEFTADLADRYRSEAFAASPEIFALKAGEEPKVVGAFAK